MAPLAVIVAAVPGQIEGFAGVIEIVGEALTVTEVEAVLVQLFEVPVTIYDVVTVGLTIFAAVVILLLQEYEVAPLAVNVAVAPAQIVGAGVRAIVGTAFTTIS